ncbi:MAG: bifunctional 5,10-methylene-tetrahydrofolate dehydrogenase/5,10-methylene-tetrahydrofolate cyclohydrolase, partial [Gammaproteobacteria bacterium]|nr:bifunctional 5,10-methylene-tetrahydrofolate dehydrogenase/5,10-methylene-tetrahydrofolate cyclohydrolase [Gammaproteobacteria bacterium]
MSAAIISGTEIADAIRRELRERVAVLKERDELVPGLAP